MRAIWKGSISFGLVSIPVKLYAATEERDIAFRQVHREDGGRIRYKRECQTCGTEVAYADIAKGYENSDGSIVVLTDDDLASVPLTTSRAVDVVQFVPLEQIDPIHYAKSYYLEPDKSGVKPYVLLAKALEDSGMVAVVKVALRQREQLAALRVRDGVFVLETMLWPDEVRTPEFAFMDEEVEVRQQELAMATTLIDSLTGDFDPEAHHDAYREALEDLISAKVEGHEVVQPATPVAETGGVVDLMAALRASVDAAKRKAAGGDSGAQEPTPKTKASAKGATAAKKAPAKKAAAKDGAKPAKAAAKEAKPRKAPARKSA